MLADIRHEGAGDLGGGDALQLNALHVGCVAAEGAIEGVRIVGQVHAVLLGIGGGLADQHRGDHGVLVAGIGALEIAAALLKAEDELVLVVRGLQAEDLAADILEAGQHVLRRDVVGGGNRIGQGRGDDGLDDLGVLRQIAALGTGAQDVIQQDAAELVAAELAEAALDGNGDRGAVGVGVGAHDQIGMDLVCDLVALVQRSVSLRIGVGAGGEIAVGLGLRRNHRILHADAAEKLLHRAAARAAQGGVDDV